MQPIAHETDLDELRRGSVVYAVICAWAKLGLFQQFSNGPVPLSELPGDLRSIQVTARILGHAGLLTTDGERWGLSSVSTQMIDQGVLNIGGGLDAMRVLSGLDELLLEGGPAKRKDGSSLATEGGVRDQDPEDVRRFLDMLYRRSEHSAKETARWFAERLPEGGHILDVGGGHGRYSEALSHYGFSATIVDKPVCCDITKERYGDRFQTIGGNFFEVDLKGPYDGALLSNIIHGLGPDEIQDLLGRLQAVIRPGGVIVIKDMFIDETHVSPEAAVIFAMTMLLYTPNGNSYATKELDRWCEQADFTPSGVVQARDQRFSLYFATRKR